MKQPTIYALDFDGVICDSAIETGITGWKVAQRLWEDMPTVIPSAELIDQFRQVRPIIETGYESVLAMRMLFEGVDCQNILNDFYEKRYETLAQSNQTVTKLKEIFGATRDEWIQNDLSDWISMNPLFPGVAKKLADLIEQNVCYIVTTKQERFVSEILNANHIDLSGAKIFGLDRNLSKPEILTNLLAKHPNQNIYFVEDRLPALINVLENDELKSVKLFLADWGYNTEQDRLNTNHHPIDLINLQEFIDL